MKMKNIKVYGLEESIKASGYPTRFGEPADLYTDEDLFISDKEFKRAVALGNSASGSGHGCFLKGITVNFDLQYSLYFTKQIQRYHFIDFVSSQSTMYTLTKRKDVGEYCNSFTDQRVIDVINNSLRIYNDMKKDEVRRIEFNGITTETDKHELFMTIVSNLPSGFELWARFTTNYYQLQNIYKQRCNHKLDDWIEFCNYLEELPEFKRLCLTVKE